MFSFFTKSNPATNACCGNREKGSAQTQQIPAPTPSQPAGDGGADAPAPEDGDPVNRLRSLSDVVDVSKAAENLQNNAAEMQAAAVGVAEDAALDFHSKASAVALDAADAALNAAGGAIDQISSGRHSGRLSNGERVSHHAGIHSAGIKPLESFEERNEKDDEDGGQGELSDASHDSDEDDFRKYALNLRAERKAMKKSFGGGKTPGHAHAVLLEAVTEASKDPTQSFPAPRGTGKLARSATATGARPTLARSTTGMSLGGDAEESATRMSMIAGGASTASMDDLVRAQSKMSLAGMSPKAEEEEEDEDENPNDETSINKRYRKRYPDVIYDMDGDGIARRRSNGEMRILKQGVAARVEELRLKCERAGDEEPIDAQTTVVEKKRKLRTLTIVFFTDPNSEEEDEKTIVFRSKPLGMQWDKRAPVMISYVKADSHAVAVGVKPLYTIKEINHINVENYKYLDIHTMLMTAVEQLPKADELPKQEANPSLAARLPPGSEGQVLTTRVRVTLKAARGFQNDEAVHFCVCMIPGKPHSKVHTGGKCVLDTPETADLSWNETYELFDYQRGDSIEFSVYARATEVPSKTTFEAVLDALDLKTMTKKDLQGRAPKMHEMVCLYFDQGGNRGGMNAILQQYPDFGKDDVGPAPAGSSENSLGKVRLGWDAFSAKCVETELTLCDPRTGQATKTKMQVRVETDLVPEKQQAINTFRRVMRDRMLSLKINEKDVNTSFPDLGDAHFTSASDAVRDSLKKYHHHSENLGIFMPFPGKAENDGYNELDQEQNRKLSEYSTKLNNDEAFVNLAPPPDAFNPGSRVQVRKRDGYGHFTWYNGTVTKVYNPPVRPPEVRMDDEKIKFDPWDVIEKLKVVNKPCPGGCNFVLTWHETHCCDACKKNDGKPGKFKHSGKCDQKEWELEAADRSMEDYSTRYSTASYKSERASMGFMSSLRRHAVVEHSSVQVMGKELSKHMKKTDHAFLPKLPNLVIHFEDLKKEKRPIVFESAPIGINFTKRMPLKVVDFKGGSIAEAMGVEKGWKITDIDGYNISKLWYKDAYHVLSECLAKLAQMPS